MTDTLDTVDTKRVLVVRFWFSLEINLSFVVGKQAIDKRYETW